VLISEKKFKKIKKHIGYGWNGQSFGAKKATKEIK